MACLILLAFQQWIFVLSDFVDVMGIFCNHAISEVLGLVPPTVYQGGHRSHPFSSIRDKGQQHEHICKPGGVIVRVWYSADMDALRMETKNGDGRRVLLARDRLVAKALPLPRLLPDTNVRY